jgi:hypothetical protein
MKILPIHAKPREWIEELDAARNVMHANLPLTSAFSESKSLREATVAIISIGDMVRGSVVDSDYASDVVTTDDPDTEGTDVTELPPQTAKNGGDDGDDADIPDTGDGLIPEGTPPEGEGEPEIPEGSGPPGEFPPAGETGESPYNVNVIPEGGLGGGP